MWSTIAQIVQWKWSESDDKNDDNWNAPLIKKRFFVREPSKAREFLKDSSTKGIKIKYSISEEKARVIPRNRPK